jgi:hypothetical protein
VCFERATPEKLPEPWLQSLGFRFDPFQHLESSADPHLGEYIVAHEASVVAWDDAPALVFAPAGGGKTTMRIYTARSCWIGLGGYHPFPIPYVLPKYIAINRAPSLDEHLAGIVQAGVVALLMSLSFRPEAFLALDKADRRALAAILDRSFPGSLPYYLEMLREDGTQALASQVDGAYVLPNPPAPPVLYELCAGLEAALLSKPLPSIASTPCARLEELVALLRGPLGFRSVFVLLDGADAFPETMADPTVAAMWVAPLLLEAPHWARQHVLIKAFLPIDTQPPLTDLIADVLPSMRQARLEWTPGQLAEVIRKRVYVASGGEIGSLDAISGPALHDLETMLTKLTPPLPREAIVLVRRVLFEYTQRAGGNSGRLEPSDVEVAVKWYQRNQVWPASESTTIAP